MTVTDVKGRFVSDLNAKDFKIFDEGKEQKIEFFTRERNQPVVVGFLLDLSSASKIHWKTYQEAAIDLISTLLPNDPKYSGYLITYSTDAEVAVNTTQDSEKLIERVASLRPAVARRLRRDLDGMYQPQAGEGRAVRAAASHRGHRRRSRQREQENDR